ncbi:hypothetical protein PRIPAC_86721 [Pristionchus pacificus]|uniref:Uncharacterized protein n=1 Tax=Pristionchus pacificus TaxID=54126 RepID=A0A2A6BTP7_PRIPA|nr:hypothetical protein PRIPAC_86721 [Pristionchus pacificus]|eukprot:PDM69186.1 hypothetical protein PRIPAC_47488 [Pristionchus pacificus]
MFQFGMYHSIVLSNWNQKEEEEEEGCMVTASCQFNGFVIATHKEEVWREGRRRRKGCMVTRVDKGRVKGRVFLAAQRRMRGRGRMRGKGLTLEEENDSQSTLEEEFSLFLKS